MVGFISLMVSYLFLRMDAPDVAMTEAAIAAGLTTVIFLIAIRRTEEDER
jgi:multicomponent Na+:H+ antiporter subunit A